MGSPGAVLWRWLRQLCRARYAVLTVLSPTLIAATAIWAPQLLRGLLLVDLENWHLTWLTWISAMVVALGLAIYRVIQLHGDARMGVESAQDWSREITHGRMRWFWDAQTIGWPIAPTLIWVAASVIYPLTAWRITLGEAQSADSAGLSWFSVGGASVALGMLGAAACLFFLALVRTIVVGGRAAGSGLLLGEGLAYWIVARMHKDLSEQRRPMLYFPIHFAGVTDPETKRLLPGHPQLLIALVVSVCVYMVWCYRTMTDDVWVQPDWPVGFYLLLLAYCFSAIFSFLAFILDRYRIPATLALAAYVGMFADAHRYYELAPSGEAFDTSRFADAENPNMLLAALSRREAAPADRPYLHDLYGVDPTRHFVFPKWSDGKRTMVVVTASGGGIQAAAWTAQVLTGLDRRSPHISESIGLISAVSGGSVGVMHSLGQRRPRSNDGALSQLPAYDSRQRNAVNVNSQASSLEAVGWGMAFPDFVRTVSPFPINPLIDRGWALEASWWGRLGGGSAVDAAAMQEVRVRDLIHPIRQGHMPPVIFNATAVETGQRVMISPIHTESTRAGKDVDYANVHSPIDLIDYYGEAVNDARTINPRLTTAVRLSATFAYVTPVARPLPLSEGAIRAEHGSRFQLHLCDGGYADNTGLVTAIRLVHDLVLGYHAKMDEDPSFEPPFDRVIFVRIEPFPESAAKIMRDGTGLKGALWGPIAALAATRTSTQAERADLELALLMDLSAGAMVSQQDELAVLNSSRRNLERRLDSLNLAEGGDSQLRSAVTDFRSTATQLAIKGATRGDLERQLRRVRDEAEKGTDAQKNAIVSAVEAFSQETQPTATRRRIEIKTVLFRFGASEPDIETETTSGATAPHTPPLSWLLAQSDIDALRTSWQLYEEAFDAAPETVLEETVEPQPWSASYQQLDVGTLHPKILTNMAEGASQTKSTN